jgi:hypothetical protein
MKTIIIAAMLLLFAGAAQAQEHAHELSHDLCRADARFWEAQALDKKPFAKLRINESLLRISEMAECLAMDGSTQNEIQRYQFVYIVYVSESDKRRHDFLVRHNLNQQFLDEHAAGQR